MQPGRTPAWNVFADLVPGSWLETIEFASGDRLQLPAQLRRCVSWGAPDRNLPLLAKICSDGAVVAAPLAGREDELAMVRSVIDAQASDRGDLIFAAMAIYSQLSLQPDGRLRVSPILVRHLGGRKEGVWVGAFDNELKLWSHADWDTSLAKAALRLRQALTEVDPAGLEAR